MINWVSNDRVCTFKRQEVSQKPTKSWFISIGEILTDEDVEDF